MGGWDGLAIMIAVGVGFGAVSILRFDSFTSELYIAYKSSFDRTAAVNRLRTSASSALASSIATSPRGYSLWPPAVGSDVATRSAPTVWPSTLALVL